jgi:sarcosine oxidase
MDSKIRNVGADIEVDTPKGKYLARKVVITAGPWASNFLGTSGKCLSLMRQTTHWFMPEKPQDFFRDKVPVFMVADQEGFFYGFPMVDPEGVKIARHYGQVEVHQPSEIMREILPEDDAALRVFLNRRIPTLAKSHSPLAKTCIYTLSPDRHFLVGPLPENPNIIVGAGFSGHGFKFASVVGEILSQLVSNQPVSLNIEFLNLGRFLNDSDR